MCVGRKRAERAAGGSEGGKQSGSGGLLPCARAVVSGWWSEQSSGVGEFAVLGVRFGGGGVCGALCVAKVGSGCAGTGYEVGGWGERHGALNDERALWLVCRWALS